MEMEKSNMQAAEYLKRPYGRLVIPESDGTFVAEIFEFSGCYAVGSTASEALANLEEVAVDWIQAALEQGQSIPEPMESIDHSGKLVLRMSKGLHKKAAQCAEREGVSLNSFITTCLAEHVGLRSSPLIVQPQPQRVAASFLIEVAWTSTYPMLQSALQPQLAASSQGHQLVIPSITRRREAAHARR